MRRPVRWIVLALVAVAVLPFLLARFRTPSNDREWIPSHRLAPRVAIRGDLVEIRNVREFVYRSESDFDARYATRVYDLRKLDSVWYAVSRFSAVPGMAHAFLTLASATSTWRSPSKRGAKRTRVTARFAGCSATTSCST